MPSQTSESLDGRALSRAYYFDVVAPLLEQHCPVPHAAGRLGSGSDVLGFDDEVSRDHDWGLRLNLMVEEGDIAKVQAALEAHLPDSYRGFPTRFPTTWQPDEAIQVDVATAEELVRSRLGSDLPQNARDWLRLSGQGLLEVTAGPIFHDDLGVITDLRRRLSRYPVDVRWHKVAETLETLQGELPQWARCAQRGDRVGAALLAARNVHSVMHLGFLAEQEWPPYPKWFGLAYARLALATKTLPLLELALAAEWPSCEKPMFDALQETYHCFGLASPLTETFFDRPHRSVSWAAIEEAKGKIQDPTLGETS